MWILVQRLGVVLFTALSVDQLLKVFSLRQIKSDTIYSSGDIAALLKVEKGVVLELIKSGDIKARKIKGKYNILGQNLKDFLNA